MENFPPITLSLLLSLPHIPGTCQDHRAFWYHTYNMPNRNADIELSGLDCRGRGSLFIVLTPCWATLPFLTGSIAFLNR